MTKTDTVKPPEKGNAVNKPLAADTQHPDVHPSRHAPSGMQEPNTAAGGAPDTAKEPPVAGGMALIGANAPQANTGQPGSGTLDQGELVEQDYVYTHEQALALPVVDKGAPQKMPSDKQIDALHKKAIDAEKSRIRQYNETREGDKKLPLEGADGLPRRVPIVAFKDAFRRTMQVVKTKDGLAAMPSKEYTEVKVPEAA